MDKSNAVTLVLLENIKFIRVTLEVSKLERSKFESAVLLNIADIVLTFEVLKVETSREVRDVVPKNIPVISVTIEVSNSGEVRSREVKLEFWNILNIVVAAEVLSPDKFIVPKFVTLRNI